MPYAGAVFGQGTLNLPIVLDDVGCSGFELRLVDCYYDNNTGDCSHSEDASVRCHSRKNLECHIHVKKDTEKCVDSMLRVQWW